MAQAVVKWPRGAASIVDGIRALCKFSRKYDYRKLLKVVTGNDMLGLALEGLIIACDAFNAVDSLVGKNEKGDSKDATFAVK